MKKKNKIALVTGGVGGKGTAIKKKIALALQGGGSHGAYTWGILERLLEEDRFDIRGCCGASSGVMNGVLVTYGLHIGNNQTAIDLLNEYWTRFGIEYKNSPMQPGWFDQFHSPGSLEYSPSSHFMFEVFKHMSAYQLDPVGEHTRFIKDTLLRLIDFDELRKSKIQLFACATNVLTSKPRIFNLSEMTVDTILASSALPIFFKAVKIDGEYFWDGLFLCNPQIAPLIDYTDAKDILIVKLSPVISNKVPKTIREIAARAGNIGAHTSLMAEMKLLHLKDQLVDRGITMNGKLRKIYYHQISADFVMDDLTYGSANNFSPNFLNILRQRGRKEAEKWLNGDANYVGQESTFDIKSVFS
jgi:NTE family protein